MIALFFEVLPAPGHESTYFEMASGLKPALDASGGLLFLDRSRSTQRPGWFLSHQFWRDEASMTRWRVNASHHRAQACGRSDVLADYRLRVAQVIASATAGSPIGYEPVPDAVAYNDPAAVAERYIVSILAKGALDVCGGETFASIYDASLAVHVVPVASKDEGNKLLAHAAANARTLHARLCLISRDYGMLERSEAPQYFGPARLA